MAKKESFFVQTLNGSRPIFLSGKRKWATKALEFPSSSPFTVSRDLKTVTAVIQCMALFSYAVCFFHTPVAHPAPTEKQEAAGSAPAEAQKSD